MPKYELGARCRCRGTREESGEDLYLISMTPTSMIKKIYRKNLLSVFLAVFLREIEIDTPIWRRHRTAHQSGNRQPCVGFIIVGSGNRCELLAQHFDLCLAPAVPDQVQAIAKAVARAISALSVVVMPPPVIDNLRASVAHFRIDRPHRHKPTASRIPPPLPQDRSSKKRHL